MTVHVNQSVFTFEGTDTTITFMRDADNDIWVSVVDLEPIMNLANTNISMRDIANDKKHFLESETDDTGLIFFHETEAIKLLVTMKPTKTKKGDKIRKFQNWFVDVINTIRKQGFAITDNSIKIEQLKCEAMEMKNEKLRLEMAKLKLLQDIKNEAMTQESKNMIETLITKSIIDM